MHVLVTGAAGFIGSALVHALRIGHHVTAVDRDDGDIADPAFAERLFATPVDRVYHLAAIVSGAAEADFDAGRRVNLEATMGLLAQCRAQAARGGPLVRFVYASSIAVFGTPLPLRIDDRTQPLPTLSYGTHKRVCELLIDDATRRGDLDGRSLRLPGVVVRPALPNGALSAFNSDLIRESLAGRDYACPVGPEATIWITSRRAAVANLLHLGDAYGGALGAHRAFTAPALALSIAAIVAAVARVDPAAAKRIRYQPQPAIEAQFGRWPIRRSFASANKLGLVGEESIDTLIRDHLDAVDRPVTLSEAKDPGVAQGRDPSLRSG